MKRNKIIAGLIVGATLMLPMQSCIGQFTLTKKVMSWNNQVGSKFVNELVFFAFWILPVYEVTSLADLIVLNSIEFWSGNNPIEASVKVVDTEQGKYYIACDQKGYEIKAPNNQIFRLDFDSEDQTWSVKSGEDEAVPFMTMLDPGHVKIITPSGDFRKIELSSQGLLGYQAMIKNNTLANN